MFFLNIFTNSYFGTFMIMIKVLSTYVIRDKKQISLVNYSIFNVYDIFRKMDQAISKQISTIHNQKHYTFSLFL